MKKGTVTQSNRIKAKGSYVAEPLETKLQKLTEQKIPIEQSTPLIYTERKNGVEPAYDIRTDRWEIAQMAMDAISKAELAKRDGGMINEENMGGEQGQETHHTSQDGTDTTTD